MQAAERMTQCLGALLLALACFGAQAQRDIECRRADCSAPANQRQADQARQQLERERAILQQRQREFQEQVERDRTRQQQMQMEQARQQQQRRDSNAQQWQQLQGVYQRELERSGNAPARSSQLSACPETVSARGTTYQLGAHIRRAGSPEAALRELKQGQRESQMQGDCNRFPNAEECRATRAVVEAAINAAQYCGMAEAGRRMQDMAAATTSTPAAGVGLPPAGLGRDANEAGMRNDVTALRQSLAGMSTTDAVAAAAQALDMLGKPAATMDPALDYAGQACSYFTQPMVRADGGGLNTYADGSYVCYGERMYECAERRWRNVGRCDAYADWQSKRAEIRERSSFSTTIYEELQPVAKRPGPAVMETTVASSVASDAAIRTERAERQTPPTDMQASAASQNQPPASPSERQQPIESPVSAPQTATVAATATGTAMVVESAAPDIGAGTGKINNLSALEAHFTAFLGSVGGTPAVLANTAMDAGNTMRRNLQREMAPVEQNIRRRENQILDFENNPPQGPLSISVMAPHVPAILNATGRAAGSTAVETGSSVVGGHVVSRTLRGAPQIVNENVIPDQVATGLVNPSSTSEFLGNMYDVFTDSQFRNRVREQMGIPTDAGFRRLDQYGLQ